MSSILIIDDEPGIRTVLSDILRDESYTVLTAQDGYEGLNLLSVETVDLVVLDVWLPNMGGIDVLKAIKKDYPEIEVIIISGHANIDIAVKAVKLGAFDFLEKPLSLEKVVNIVRNALQLETLKKENRTLKDSLFIEDEMIGTAEGIEKIRHLIAQSAATDAKILITGENGTGKELVAREVHRRSSRANGPFVQVNCAAIPDTLIESELFGHEKGAFTSAVARRKGKFELADKGSLFLDEIADMSLSAQAKVLRALQEMRFERIGGEQSIESDVRVMAATNKDISKLIKDGLFREDLFFRLNVVPIHVPPLRERQEDLPLLINYFLRKFSDTDRTISDDGMKVLLSHPWPGNIRELKNFIERISIMTDEEAVSSDTVKFYLGEIAQAGKPTVLKGFSEMKLNEAKDAFEQMFLTEKLAENGFNISKTAQILGIYPSNLHGKIRKFGIEIKR